MDAPSDRVSDWTQVDAERWLLELELFGIDFGLRRIELLLEALGSPQRLPALVHVVGSNGKSSVTRMVAAILGEHGLSVGAYLSPHFVSFTERVLVDGVSRRDATELAARTDNNRVVNFAGPRDLIGTFTEITISAVSAHTLRGEPITENSIAAH